MNRSITEKKVRSGLQDTSDGGLGHTLEQWNNSYFRDHGLFVQLELSEFAVKRSEGKSNIIRKGTWLYTKREDRERKQEERKFVIVVTKLDEKGVPSGAVHELVGDPIAELPAQEEAKYEVTELPGDEVQIPVELPAMETPVEVSRGYGSEKFSLPNGLTKLEVGGTQLAEKGVDSPIDTQVELKRRPFSFISEAEAFRK